MQGILNVRRSFAFQVSQVYQTMKIEVLSKMIPFFSFSVVERVSVDAMKYNFVAMKVDHLKGVISFDSMVRAWNDDNIQLMDVEHSVCM